MTTPEDILEKYIRKYARTQIREMSMMDRAFDIAMQAHLKQKRRSSGKPYIVHPQRVATRARQLGYNKTIQIAAILHDVVEDAPDPRRYAQLIKNYFGSKILKIVKALSHGKNKPYNEYLASLWKKNPKAFKVKMVDMMDNLADNPTKSQYTKYKEAIKYIRDLGADIPKTILKTLELN